MRRLLTISSDKTPGVLSAHIIFSKTAYDEPYHFSPSFGASSSLEERMRKRLIELPFLAFPLSLSEDDRLTYFKNLTLLSNEYGGVDTADEATLNFLHLVLSSRFRQEDILPCVEACLDITTQRTTSLDEELAELLKNLNAQSRFLSMRSENRLKTCLKKTVVPELREEGRIYFYRTLLRREQTDAIAYLSDLPTEELSQVLKHLVKNLEGRHLYNAFLKSKVEEVSLTNLAVIQEFIQSLLIWPDLDAITEELLDKARRAYRRELSVENRYSIYLIYRSILDDLAGTVDDIEEAQHLLLQTFSVDTLEIDDETRNCLNLVSLNDPRKWFYTDIFKLVEELQGETDLIHIYETWFQFVNGPQKVYNKVLRQEGLSLAKLASLLGVSEQDRLWLMYFDETNDLGKATLCYEMKTALLLKDYSVFMDKHMAYQMLKNERVDYQSDSVYDLLRREVRIVDSEEIVPLDIWLLIGMYSPSSLIITDSDVPRIFNCKLTDIIKSSVLISDASYRKSLQDYVKRKGSYSKIVDKVLKQTAKVNKEEGVSLFAKVLSFGRKAKTDRER